MVRDAIESARPEILINCVAMADVDRCESDSEWAYAVNASGPRFLARACRKVGAEIVHVSTDYVFDASKRGSTPGGGTTPTRSACTGSRNLRASMRYGRRRSDSTSCGLPGVWRGAARTLGAELSNMRARAALKGVIDQTSIPTYAPDLADRIEEIIELGAHALYQVTSSGPTTWFEFARLALDLAGLTEVKIELITRAQLNQPAVTPPKLGDAVPRL